jgi:GNAT superfamily N-acetyltransferase
MSGQGWVEWLEAWPCLPVPPEGSRREGAERLVRELERRREAGQLVEGEGGVVAVRREAWDCERLGLEAGKLELLIARSERGGRELLQRAVEKARGQGLVHLTCRLDSRDYTGAAALQGAGFSLRDLLVTLAVTRPKEPAEAPTGVRRATERDVERLAELSARCFSTPGDSYNRYLNDPHLPLAGVREVYAYWARTSLGGPAADLTLVVEEEGELAGFLTLVLPRDGVAKVPLNAVDARWRGRGLYRTLVQAGLAEAWKHGAQRVEVVTQLQQLAVQRTWWRLGGAAQSSSMTWSLWLGDGVGRLGG